MMNNISDIEQVLKQIVDAGYDILIMSHQDGGYRCALVNRANATDINGYGDIGQAIGDAVRG